MCYSVSNLLLAVHSVAFSTINILKNIFIWRVLDGNKFKKGIYFIIELGGKFFIVSAILTIYMNYLWEAVSARVLDLPDEPSKNFAA